MGLVYASRSGSTSLTSILDTLETLVSKPIRDMQFGQQTAYRIFHPLFLSIEPIVTISPKAHFHCRHFGQLLSLL